MAATIGFLAGGYGFPINNLNGSGLGFFGSAGFGNSVAVGAYQGSTFITDGNGVSQGPQVNNVQWIHPASGAVQGGVVLNVQAIPNYQSTLNIHFTNTTPVRTQNAQLYIYDRTSTSNAPSGVTCAVVPIIHPYTGQTTVGSGSSQWEFPSGSSYVNLSVTSNQVLFSPGLSGYSPNGGATTDQTHDFYACISPSPNSVGAKTLFGCFIQLEYL